MTGQDDRPRVNLSDSVLQGVESSSRGNSMSDEKSRDLRDFLWGSTDSDTAASLDVSNIRFMKNMAYLIGLIQLGILILSQFFKMDITVHRFIVMNMVAAVAVCAVTYLMSFSWLRSAKKSHLFACAICAFAVLAMLCICLSVAVFSYNNGRQMLVYFLAVMCSVCFVRMRPVYSMILYSMFHIILFTFMYRHDGAAGVIIPNYVLYILVAISVAIANYHIAVREIKNKKDVKGLMDHLKEVSYHDSLTGLANRYALNEAFEPQTGRTYFAAMADINDFKELNDTFGHKAGDDILRQVAGVLKKHYDEDEVYRYGGDEFLILTLDSNREVFMHRIRDMKKDLVAIKLPANRSGLSISCGIAEGLASDRESVLNLVQKADDRMYRIKKGFTDGVSDEENLNEKISEAMRSGQIVAFYQPKVDIRDNSIIGAEALVRWRMKNGIVPPGSFLPILEETGDICKLDMYLFRRVCSEIAAWVEKGIKVPCISCNFSMKHLANVHFVDDLLQIADHYKVSHEKIEIEMTETVNAEEIAELQSVIRRLRQLDFHTAIDDFGTGYSSLSLIKDVPVDVVKLDKALLSSYGDFTKLSDNDRALMRHIVGLVKDMQMMCLAEGVETVQQKDFLRSINCNYVQGFLYDRPLPAEVFEQRLIEGGYEEPEKKEEETKAATGKQDRQFDLRLLLAEDNEINREITVNLLEGFGARVVAAVDGLEALNCYTESASGEFDGILMDIQMPVMDGYESARAIRALDRSDAANVPIIAITVDSYKETRDRAEKAGMSGHVTKPLDPSRLYDLLVQLEDARNKRSGA